ncbi:MAG: glycosyltransferase family A protein, partial [Candidatus Latescibacterota bacterium]
MVKLSVIVCTYNRSPLLVSCLDSLVNQTLPVTNFEIVLVNNNSTDDTQAIAERYAGGHGNIRVINELKQGLSHARNRGWQEAKGKYVAYIDDDAKTLSDWAGRVV